MLERANRRPPERRIQTTTEQKNFIESIATCVNKLKGGYDIKVASPIIAQAIIESNWGKSGLAKYHNYFGLKCGSYWKGASVNMNTKEEYKAGVLTNISANFRVYASMEEGVKGYFDFINTKRYANLKNVTDPGQYLRNIKADGYATDSKYVSKMLTCITNYGLKVYDTEVAPVQQYVSKNKSTDGSGIMRAVQKWLNDNYGKYIKECEVCGKALLETDGFYGKKTKAALVIALQVWLNDFEGVNLRVDGKFGAKTKAICKIVSTTVNTYTRGAQIVQAILYCNGYNPQMFGEIFNVDCENALKAYQKEHGLESDGVAGKHFFDKSLK